MRYHFCQVALRDRFTKNKIDVLDLEVQHRKGDAVTQCVVLTLRKHEGERKGGRGEEGGRREGGGREGGGREGGGREGGGREGGEGGRGGGVGR